MFRDPQRPGQRQTSKLWVGESFSACLYLCNYAEGMERDITLFGRSGISRKGSGRNRTWKGPELLEHLVYSESTSLRVARAQAKVKGKFHIISNIHDEVQKWRASNQKRRRSEHEGKDLQLLALVGGQLKITHSETGRRSEIKPWVKWVVRNCRSFIDWRHSGKDVWAGEKGAKMAPWEHKLSNAEWMKKRTTGAEME